MIAVFGFIAIHLVLVVLGALALWVADLIDLPAGGRLWPALGPSYVAGVAVLMPWLVIVLLLGIPLTFATAVVAAALGMALLLVVGRRLGRHSTAASSRQARPLPESLRALWSTRVLPAGAAAAFVTWGAYALARTATVGDDARIWSLRGLTLTYYGRLQPEVFLSQAQSGLSAAPANLRSRSLARDGPSRPGLLSHRALAAVRRVGLDGGLSHLAPSRCAMAPRDGRGFCGRARAPRSRPGRCQQRDRRRRRHHRERLPRAGRALHRPLA